MIKDNLLVVIYMFDILIISLQGNFPNAMLSALLDEFKDRNPQPFEDLLNTLERTNRGNLAIHLRDSLNKIQNEEAELGSDFIDFIKIDKTQW